MIMNKIDNLPEAKLLGKNIAFPQSYDASILVAVPREINRKQYHLDSDQLPFVGYDVWHGYELSFLTLNGLPVNRVLKMVYSSSTPNIVESKSFKLYLNSLNNSRYGVHVTDGLIHVKELIERDLSEIVGGEVKCSFFNNLDEMVAFDFDQFQVLEDTLDLEEEDFLDFKEAPTNLMFALQGERSIKVCSNILRSNCKITEQPDWGTVYITLDAEHGIDLLGLLKYLVSFRNENHFHEEICEMIYKRLLDAFKPSKLAVTCIYTRRGGIDICPTRASNNELLPLNLINPNLLTKKLLRQ